MKVIRRTGLLFLTLFEVSCTTLPPTEVSAQDLAPKPEVPAAKAPEPTSWPPASTAGNALASASFSGTTYGTSSAKEFQEFSAGEPGPYLIGAGDLLHLRSLTSEYADEELKVAPDGTIGAAPNAQVKVANLDLVAAERAINAALALRFDNVEIKLSLVDGVSRKAMLLGDVRDPGVVLLDGDVSLAEAIARSGGLQVTANDALLPISYFRIECRIVRSNGKSLWVDLSKALFQNEAKHNPLLRNGDIIYVYKHY